MMFVFELDGLNVLTLYIRHCSLQWRGRRAEGGGRRALACSGSVTTVVKDKQHRGSN